MILKKGRAMILIQNPRTICLKNKDLEEIDYENLQK